MTVDQDMRIDLRDPVVDLLDCLDKGLGIGTRLIAGRFGAF